MSTLSIISSYLIVDSKMFLQRKFLRVISIQLLLLLSAGEILAAEDEAPQIPTFNSEEEMLENMKSIDVRAVIILSYGNGDEKCEKTIERLSMVETMAEIAKYAEEEHGISGGMLAAKLKDKTYDKTHSFKGCPNLILYREKKPVVYAGENLSMRFDRDEIGQWVASSMKSSVSHLSDETFEHLTQASTGATTGDWLVWFHETSCSDLTAVWEAVASRLQYSKVVAEVDVTLNPKLADRFKLKTCQSFLLFRQGKYYTYTGDAFDVTAFTNFAEISYQNFKSQVVRPPPSPFDEKVEQITLWLKESELGLYFLVALSFMLFGGIIYLVCQEAKQSVEVEKKSN